MARIIYSGIVSSINGSIAGTTYQRNAYGHTIKKKPTIVNPNRFKQGPIKANLQYVSQNWVNVSSANRTAWANQAVAHPVPSRLNPSANLSGHAIWLRLNLYARLIGISLVNAISNPLQDTLLPGSPEVQRVGATLLYFDDSDSSLNNLQVIAFVSGVVKPTQLYDRSRVRFMGNFALVSADSIDITAAYTAQYGSLPTAGQNLFLKRVYVNLTNGQVIEFPQQNIVCS